MEWSNNGNDIYIKKYDFSINCDSVSFPVYANFNESSELSLIKLYMIYDDIVTFFVSFMSTRHINSYSELPYCVVEKLNFISRLIINYLNAVGVDTYIPVVDWVNMNPKETTPYCEYFLESVVEQRAKVGDVLREKGIVYTKHTEKDTDWN